MKKNFEKFFPLKILEKKFLKKNFEKFFPLKILEKKIFEKFFPLKILEKKIFSAEKSTRRIRREYECLSFIFIISKHHCSLDAHFDLISFNSSYISQRRLFCFASSCLISLFSSRRLIKDS